MVRVTPSTWYAPWYITISGIGGCPLSKVVVWNTWWQNFRIHCAINSTAEEGIDIPITYYGCHFCLSYHPKVVCNSNCGGRNSHRNMSQGKMGQMTEWRGKKSRKKPPPPGHCGWVIPLWGRHQRLRFRAFMDPPLARCQGVTVAVELGLDRPAPANSLLKVTPPSPPPTTQVDDI